MIGIKYVNGNNRIMEDRIAAGSDCDTGALAHSDYNLPDSLRSSKKPSLLRSQLLRRTTTRTRKRPPSEAVNTNEINVNHIADVSMKATEASVNVSITASTDTVPQTRSDKGSGVVTKTPECESDPNKLEPVGGKAYNDDVNSFPFDELHHNTEFELKNGSKVQRDDASSSLDISLIESDEDESKIEVESNRRRSQGKPLKPKVATTSAVATANLSIVLTGNDVVVEYRDDSRDDKRCDFSERKESSPQSSQSKERPIRSRPKGIMKRPRDSNITYHHPRRPLPPPLPPPGYKEICSPMSCTTATSTDSSLLSAADRRALYPPLRKRVSFNEKELVEQYKESKQRRKERYERRRSLSGILSMAMPVIMPYFMAILILVASSMVPLPTDQKHALAVQQPLSLQPELLSMGKTRAPTPQPVLIDVGSRVWEDVGRLKKAQRAASLEAVTETISAKRQNQL